MPEVTYPHPMSFSVRKLFMKTPHGILLDIYDTLLIVIGIIRQDGSVPSEGEMHYIDIEEEFHVLFHDLGVERVLADMADQVPALSVTMPLREFSRAFSDYFETHGAPFSREDVGSSEFREIQKLAQRAEKEFPLEWRRSIQGSV